MSQGIYNDLHLSTCMNAAGFSRVTYLGYEYMSQGIYNDLHMTMNVAGFSRITCHLDAGHRVYQNVLHATTMATWFSRMTYM